MPKSLKRCHYRFLTGLLCLLVHAQTWADMPISLGDPALGYQLYTQGLGHTGEPYRGTTQGDIEFTGDQFTCANCHRPSGYGSSEGGIYVPPITAPVLFSSGGNSRNERFKELFQEVQPKKFWAQVRQPQARSAYTDKLLARALRTGIDADGKPLHPAMPRIELDEQDMANLIAFLKTLSAKADPGVDKETIHIATIFDASARQDKRAAIEQTLQAFVKWINKDIEGDLKNPGFSPYYRTDFLDAYKKWQLHIWEVNGEPETWAQQLQAQYEKQPVFAIVSGLVQNNWAPVDGFCNRAKIPCLFPNTRLPAPNQGEPTYSLHFSRGLALESEALAIYMAEQTPPLKRIIQIHSNSPQGSTPAQSFQTKAEKVLPQAQITNLSYQNTAQFKQQLEVTLSENTPPDALLFWPDEYDTNIVGTIRDLDIGSKMITLPSSFLEAALDKLAEPYADQLRVVNPFELPSAYHPRKFRVRAWFRTRQVPLAFPQLQLQTYYALTTLQFGLLHLIDEFSRDYLIEIIEHEAENQLNPGIYPSLALGPGQRIASKGAYVVRPDASSKFGYSPDSEWIIP